MIVTESTGFGFFLFLNDLLYTTGVSTDTRFNETWRLEQVAQLTEESAIRFKIFPNPSSTEITIQDSAPIK